MASSRLTPKMRELLDELIDNRRTGKGNARGSGGLYIRRYSRWGRTVEALATRGLAEKDEMDISGQTADHWIATDIAMQKAPDGEV